MDDNLAGITVVAVVLGLLVSAAVVGFEIWLVYTVIWRAVRRGMREYHREKMIEDYMFDVEHGDDDDEDEAEELERSP